MPNVKIDAYSVPLRYEAHVAFIGTQARIQSSECGVSVEILAFVYCFSNAEERGKERNTFLVLGRCPERFKQILTEHCYPIPTCWDPRSRTEPSPPPSNRIGSN